MSDESASTASGAASKSTAGPKGWWNIALWVLQVGAAAFFIWSISLPKLTADPASVEFFEVIGYGDWFMYLIGSLELIGAVALLIPILSGLASLAFIGLMIGAITFQVTLFDGEGVTAPAILLVLFGILAWGRREQTARLFALLTGRG